jgi:hypothetical protein
MNMPGFTAEVSLNSSKVQYYTRGVGERLVSGGGVVPSAKSYRDLCADLAWGCVAGEPMACWGYNRWCDFD